MAVRGTRPKPTAIKLLAGNPGHRPLQKNEPQPTEAMAGAPAWMSDTQRELWQTVVDSAPPGLLKTIDEGAMVAYIVAADIHRAAAEAIAKHGMLIKDKNTGAPVLNPFISVVAKQATVMMRAASEMGFTPSSRSRVTVAAPPKKENPFAEFLNDPKAGGKNKRA